MTNDAPRSLRAEQVEATRRAVVASARNLFARSGFAATSIEEIVNDARVTKGALYHHFTSKDDLFRVVFEEIEQELATKAVTAAEGAVDPLDQLELGFGAFLDAALDSDVQQIVLIDGPSALGWDTFHAIDEQYGYAAVLYTLEAAVASGQLEPLDVETLAHLLLGAMTNAGMLVARSEDPTQMRTAVGGILHRILEGLGQRPSERAARHPARSQKHT